MHIPDRHGGVAAGHHLALTAQEKSCATLLEWSFADMISVQQSAVILYMHFPCSLFFGNKSSNDLFVALDARCRLPVVTLFASSSEDDESTNSHSGASLFSLPLSAMSPRTSRPPHASPKPASSPLASPVLGGSPLQARGQANWSDLPTSGAHRVVDDSRHTYLRMQ
ncbi:hypothetical protein V8F44DRAFT_630250 [Aspergillus fumigatus]